MFICSLELSLLYQDKVLPLNEPVAFGAYPDDLKPLPSNPWSEDSVDPVCMKIQVWIDSGDPFRVWIITSFGANEKEIEFLLLLP